MAVLPYSEGAENPIPMEPAKVAPYVVHGRLLLRLKALVQLPLALWTLWVALVATIVSGIIYMQEGIKRLNDGHHGGH